MPSAGSFTHSYSSKVLLNTDTKTAFEYLDEPKKLSARMGRSSMMMAGSKMDMILDEKQGRDLGSVIKMTGKMMGLDLFLQEKIVDRKPFEKKYWEAFGTQRLVILDQYRMGFSLKELGKQTELTVSIQYRLPSKGISRIIGKMLAGFYAKWCTEQMTKDAERAFESKSENINV